MGNFLPALDVLLLELGNQGFGALGIHFFEGGLRVMRHGISDHRDGSKDGEQYH